MRLKTLDIKGFKSFADETVIHFNEDVIGIVGPNGSGKSNIVDAIRWVLGEQSSRELRLDTMANVIFNGTKQRKPAPYASVSLTFENTKNLLPTEYQNVTITRLLYQSGDSEYKLNNVTCRLKDITSLFLDTGIGSNSYAIIALGMVDDILNDKDNSRLRMLEQAAGISKYKIRKRETLNKLKNTDADLERVEDLLFEIKNNLKSLEKQARKTKRYFEIKNRYKNLSLQLADIKLERFRKRHRTIKNQVEQEQDKYRQYDVQTNKLEAQLEAERKNNLDKEKALTESQKNLNQLVGQIRGLENDRNMLQQRAGFVKQNQLQLERQISQHKDKVLSLQKTIEKQRATLNEDKRLEAELENQLDTAENRLTQIRKNHSSTKAGLDEVLKKQNESEKLLFELEKQKAVNLNRLDNLAQDREQAERADVQRQLEVDNLKTKIQTAETGEQDAQAKLALLEKEAENRAKAIEKYEAEAEAIQQKLTRVNRQLDAKRNEFKLTQNMVENLEGFPESIKFLSTRKDWCENAPLLSDLIYVKEEYRIAIENYLEPYLNYYVVPTMPDAYKAIQLLNQSQKGKANFFILDTFEHYEPPMALLPGTVNAFELVETEPAYRKLCSFLLENVLVTTEAQVSQAQQQGDITVLSKSGHFIKKKFSVSGGSIGLFEGKKIGRKKNLEVLEKTIRKLEKEENKLNTAFYNKKSKVEELKSLRSEKSIQTARREVNEAIQQKIALQSRMESLLQRLGEAGEKEKQLKAETEKILKANKEIEVALDTRMAEVDKSKEKITDMDASYRAIADRLSEASNNYNEKNIAFIRQQNKVSALQRELSFREKSLEEFKNNLNRDSTQLKEAEIESAEIATQLEESSQKLQEFYAARKDKESQLSKAEQVYFNARGGINEIEDQLRKINKSRNESQVLINNLKDKLNEVRLQINSMSERLRVEFNIEISALEKSTPEESKTELSEEELQAKVEKLKNRLDNYGEINPMAVEAFDTMKERYDTITQQRDDILEAKKDLMATIEEIEHTATEQFLDSFSKVRTYFIEVFRSLFTEDDAADLILLDPENPLESKIEIVAKPKGKRPQTISQLSGGEKTLTATALLFSLYLLKPAPFCIFDEVDAPLDDANIEKFNRIIKKFSEDSQFIIVTHNKLTMAAVDVIYGVYMQEQGVSSVSAVDLRSFEHSGILQQTASG